MADSVDIPSEAEHILVDLMMDEQAVESAREALHRRDLEIVAQLATKFAAQHQQGKISDDVREAGARQLVALRRGKHRSELAILAAAVVRAVRRRAETMRKLEAFPQFGRIPPALDVAIDFDGERRLTITAGGRAHLVMLPHVIDRGVYREETKYERGDAVTSDGSLWIARRNDPAHEPGKGDGWRLAVTRGRNGRDGRDATGVRPRASA